MTSMLGYIESGLIPTIEAYERMGLEWDEITGDSHDCSTEDRKMVGDELSSTGKIVKPVDPNSILAGYDPMFRVQFMHIILFTVNSCMNDKNTTHSMKIRFGCTECKHGPCDITLPATPLMCEFREIHKEERYKAILEESFL
jgi:hypothetical protein